MAEEHKKEGPKKLRIAMLVCSTSRFFAMKEGRKIEDLSSKIMSELIEKEGHEIKLREILPDDKLMIRRWVKDVLEREDIDVLITCGGTGVAPSDVTIEAIRPLLEKELPGFGELLRSLSYKEIGASCILTRALAGVAKGKVIFCLPGSPSAVKLAMENIILREASHILFHLRSK